MVYKYTSDKRIEQLEDLVKDLLIVCKLIAGYFVAFKIKSPDYKKHPEIDYLYKKLKEVIKKAQK